MPNKSLIHHIWNKSPKELMYLLKSKISGGEVIRKFSDEHPCIFVLSTGRAGTKTLAALLRLAENIHSYHEPLPALYCLSKLAYEETGNEASTRILKEAFLLSRKALLEDALMLGKGYAETSPQVTFLAPVIQALVPEAKFIHIVRDPRVVVRSAMRRNWYSGNPNDSCRITANNNSLCKVNWDSSSQFQKNVWLWTETNSWINRFCSGMSSERAIQLKSEHIFSGNMDTMNLLFRFCGSQTPAQSKLQAVLAKKLNSQESGDFPKTGEWTESMRKELQEIAGPLLVTYKYQVG